MAIQYLSAHVDERYGSKFVETLYEKNFLIPGVTFTDEYGQEAGAGRFIFHKQSDSATNAPEEVGADYNKENYANEEIHISLLNQYSESAKIPAATVAATSANVLENTYRNQAGKIATRQMRSAIACLLTEGTGTASKGGSAITEDNIRERILSAAADGAMELGDVDTVLIRPDLYAMLIGVIPKTQITNGINEQLVRDGIRVQFINWNGINIFSVPSLANKGSVNYSYITMSGTSKTTKSVTAANVQKANFIAYNHRAFAKVDLLSMVKAFDSHSFPGVEINSCVTSGFGAIYGKHIIVDKSAAS
jgi:hypothetical protein